MVITMYYINYFFIFSIIGHLFETIISNKSGILYGFWTPVYGFGCLIILFIHKLLDKYEKDKNINNFSKKIILFFTSFIILSIIELIGGFLIELIFGIEMWNYSNFMFNIGKYISLETSLIWGISSLILIYALKPFIDKIINRIPKVITYILSFLFVLDCMLTLLLKR